MRVKVCFAILVGAFLGALPTGGFVPAVAGFVIGTLFGTFVGSRLV